MKSQPKQQRRRSANVVKAFQIGFQLKYEDWREVDAKLGALVSIGALPSGAFLLHCSWDNRHLKSLMSREELSDWEIEYHRVEARKDLEDAKKFVAEFKFVKGESK